MAWRKHTVETLQQEALKYKTRKEFQYNSNGAYCSAWRFKILDQICSHMMVNVHKDWNKKTLQQEALKYKTRKEFQNNSKGAYLAARKLKILDEVCSHMINGRVIWNKETIQQEALKYKTRLAFQINSMGSYKAAHKLKILDEVCSHMIIKEIKWHKENLPQEALKYKTRKEFFNNSSGAYGAAWRFKILDQICSHMKKPASISIDEADLLNTIKQKYPKAQQLRDRKVNIPGKPHIKGFDVDIYVPELRKGIEFDGKYWHSVAGLKRSREHWETEDLENYHTIKDNYFLSRNIELLHIDEKDWISDKNQCINKCLKFLGAK